MTTKICNKCNIEKSITDFHKNSRGRYNYCSSCRSVSRKSYHPISVTQKICKKCGINQHFTLFNRCKSIKDGLSSSCKACLKKYRSQDWIKNKISESGKWYNKLRNYGISKEQYLFLCNKQNNLCAICYQIPKQNYGLVVDHNYETGKIRGLLCRECNAGIGLLKDDKKIVLNAFNYLDRS